MTLDFIAEHTENAEAGLVHSQVRKRLLMNRFVSF